MTGLSKTEFRSRLIDELDEAARLAENRLGGSASRTYKIAFGEPARRPLIDVETVVDRLTAQWPLFPRIIDVAVIGLENEETVVFVRPSDHRPSTWENTWNLPRGHGPFKVLTSDKVYDHRKPGSGTS